MVVVEAVLALSGKDERREQGDVSQGYRIKLVLFSDGDGKDAALLGLGAIRKEIFGVETRAMTISTKLTSEGNEQTG